MTNDLKLLEFKFTRAIAKWDRRNKNPSAGALALLRLDEMLDEIEGGKDVVTALEDNFNDRLLSIMKKELLK